MSKKRHKTEKGMVVAVKMGPPFEGVLADFDIEGHDLRVQHIWWITNRLVPHIKRRPSNTWKIYLTGMASHSGSASYNKKLSGRRADAVEAAIRHFLPGVRFIFEKRADGETNASPAWEDAADRAVHVQSHCLMVGVPPPPPPPRRIELPPTPDDDDDGGLGSYGGVQMFRLEVQSYFSFSYAVGGFMKMIVNIADEKRRKHCYYSITSGSLSISMGSKIDKHSNIDDTPPKNYFQARGAKGMPLTTADFEGRATMKKVMPNLQLQLRAAGTDYPVMIEKLQYEDKGWLSEDVYYAAECYVNALSEELGFDQYRDYVRGGRRF